MLRKLLSSFVSPLNSSFCINQNLKGLIRLCSTENIDGSVGLSTVDLITEKKTSVQYRCNHPTQELFSMKFNGERYDKLPIVSIKSKRNNTCIALIHNGKLVADVTTGKLGFRNAKKKTQFAAQACSLRIADVALKNDLSTVRVVVKGMTTTRLPSIKALQMAGLEVVSITDETLPKHGRPPGRRRV